MVEELREQDSYKILLRRGLKINEHIINFGFNQFEVEMKLGIPNKVYKTAEGNIRWQYYELMIELSFEKENDFLLGWIEVYSNIFTLNGNNLINKQKEYVEEYIQKNIDSNIEKEDYGSFETFFCENKWVEFQFMFNKLTNINFGS